MPANLENSAVATGFEKTTKIMASDPITLIIFQFVVIHTVKGFGIVNKAEVDVFSGPVLLF